MSLKSHEFMESNHPVDKFKRLPLVPIVIYIDEENQERISGLIDSGSERSFIDVFYAKMVNGIIIDTLRTSGISSSIETKPVIQVKISTEALDKEWLALNVGVIDTLHPNHNIILGRDFMECFKEIIFDFENSKTILNY